MAYAWPKNGEIEVARTSRPRRPVYDSAGQLNVAAMSPAAIALFASREAAEIAIATATSDGAPHTYHIRQATRTENTSGELVTVYRYDAHHIAHAVT